MSELKTIRVVADNIIDDMGIDPNQEPNEFIEFMKGKYSIDRQRLTAYIKLNKEWLEDETTFQSLAEENIQLCVADVQNQCAANPLPNGYYYGPIQIQYHEADNPVQNLIRVTVYREVRKDKSIFTS